jgi:hypothetical protein
MLWEMMISFHSASKGVGGWVVLPFFFHFDQKLGKRHGMAFSLFLNHELAKFARERIDTIFTMKNILCPFHVVRLIGRQQEQPRDIADCLTRTS